MSQGYYSSWVGCKCAALGEYIIVDLAAAKKMSHGSYDREESTLIAANQAMLGCQAPALQGLDGEPCQGTARVSVPKHSHALAGC